MKHRIFAWLAAQLWPHLTPGIAAQIAQAQTRQDRPTAPAPARRYIGQK